MAAAAALDYLAGETAAAADFPGRRPAAVLLHDAAAGGDGAYVYALVPDGNSPLAGDFTASNVIPATAAGDYDVYVRDNNGNAGYCETESLFNG